MESKESWLNLLERVGKNLRLVFTSACSGSQVDLLEPGEEEFGPVQDTSLEAGRKASRRCRALVLGSSCGWRGLRLADWLLLGQLVLREDADVEPRGVAR